MSREEVPCLQESNAMIKKYSKSLFIFRRDLRLTDNHGLQAALAQSKQVIPCFIFDPLQVGDKNSYRSTNAIQFMIQSLQELDDALKKRGRIYISFTGILKK